ncbi:MAG: hypothetical protein ACRCWI_04335 [Brevinema sp.]
MQLYPSFYFRPLPNTIKLSHFFNISLRNPTNQELPIFEESIRNLSTRLSDKERRRILYTLYPLGNFMLEGTLEKQFVQSLSRIWIVAYTDQKLPFEKGLVDYGFLCGFSSDQEYLRNPCGFICDINTLSPRELLRALKKELPKAAKLILNPSSRSEDLQDLIQQANSWDGIFAQNTFPYIPLATTLRTAGTTKDPIQQLLQYCIASEILLVHNPSKGDSKMPINRQFTNKLALVRYMMIKLKNQQHLNTPEELQILFTQLYDLRSQIIHGRQQKPPPKFLIAQYLNILFPTIRLAIELQGIDPLLIEFIKKI